MTARDQERELAQRLLAIAEAMAESRAVTLGDDAIRTLPQQVAAQRQVLFGDDGPRLIDAEASCVAELLIALSYARSEQDAGRESRMVMFLNSFILFLRQDLARATA
jgi:hypothetical protein